MIAPSAQPNRITLMAAWLGWMCDGLDSYLYTLVAVPFVSSFVAKNAALSGAEQASRVQAVFMVGWALGGGIFGAIGDRFGRRTALIASILLFSVFTALLGFAHSLEEVYVLRFTAALGIGGEWASGSSLLSEAWGNRRLPWVGALIQTAFQVGTIGAVIAYAMLGDSYRPIFLVGLVPILFALPLRYFVSESEIWRTARTKSVALPASALFRGETREKTVMAMAMSSVCLTAVWTILFFSPHIIRAVPEVRIMAEKAQVRQIQVTVILMTFANVVGNFLVAWISSKKSYRVAFAFALLTGAACYLMAPLSANSLALTRVWLCATMLLFAGVSSIFPMYLPPLFPTLLRTTGAGFSYNFGRIFAGIGIFAGGWLEARDGARAPIVVAGGLLLLGALLVRRMPNPHLTREGTL